MKLIEEANPELEGVLPRNIYQASNIPAENIAGLIEVFSRDVFGSRSADAVDILGATYIYFISEFASSEGLRGGEFFTPASIVKLLVAMLEPISGKVDWTNPRRSDVLSKVNLAVKMVLIKEKITGEQLKFLTNSIVDQAKDQYRDWPRNFA